MMRNWIVAALAGVLLLVGAPASGQQLPGCPLPGVACTAIDAFTPTGSASLSASTSSSRVALGSTGGNLAVLVTNGGAVTAYVALGSVTVVATTSSIQVAAGASVALPAGSSTYLAGITGSSTATLTIKTGTGWPAIVTIGNPASGGDATAANQVLQLAQETISATGVGAPADAAWTSGSGSIIAVLKAIAARGQALMAASLPVVIASNQSAVPVSGSVSLVPTTSGGLLQSSVIVPANTTSVALKASAGQLYGIDGFSISAATPVFIKFYNAAQGSTTCGSGTPVARYMIPGLGTGGSGVIKGDANGVAYSTALTYCITAGIADNDTTNPAASTYIVNFSYK